MSAYPNPVVTCTIYKDDTFLVIRRRDGAKKFGGLWGFPGGKVEVGETIVGALKREVKEETNLELGDDFLLVDSYYYGESLGFILPCSRLRVRCNVWMGMNTNGYGV